jgi:hypothetical protein
MGIGEIMLINYVSHIIVDVGAQERMKDAGMQQQSSEEEEDMMINNPMDYCLYVCRKIAFFITIF